MVEAAGNSPNWRELSPIVDWGSPSAPHSPPEVPAPIPVPAVGLMKTPRLQSWKNQSQISY